MGGGDGSTDGRGKLHHGGTWRHEHEWPLARADYQDFYFHRGGLLSTELPAAGELPLQLRIRSAQPGPHDRRHILFPQRAER